MLSGLELGLERFSGLWCTPIKGGRHKRRVGSQRAMYGFVPVGVLSFHDCIKRGRSGVRPVSFLARVYPLPLLAEATCES
jgi:hypothetical protein